MFDISDVLKGVNGGVGSGSRLDRMAGERLGDPALEWRFIADWPAVGIYDEDWVRENIVAEEVNVPFKGTSPISRHAGAYMSYFPDFFQISSFDATFYLDNVYAALAYLADWKAEIADSDGNYQEAVYYKRQMSVFGFSQSDSQTPVIEFSLNGVWVYEFNPIPYTYEGSDRLKLSASFSVDSSKIIPTSPIKRRTAESYLQQGQRILRNGRRGLREFKDLANIL